MRVQEEISGKDESTQPLTLLPHKTRSKLSRSGQVSTQQIQDLRGGRGVQGFRVV